MNPAEKMNSERLQSELTELERKIELLEDVIVKLQERNERVEGDKAWELSWRRTIVISLLTYVVASAVLYSIGAENYLLSALIPTLGFYLSTLSLPWLKRVWLTSRSKGSIPGGRL